VGTDGVIDQAERRSALHCRAIWTILGGHVEF
jgi:hypothetical protein